MEETPKACPIPNCHNTVVKGVGRGIVCFDCGNRFDQRINNDRCANCGNDMDIEPEEYHLCSRCEAIRKEFRMGDTAAGMMN